MDRAALKAKAEALGFDACGVAAVTRPERHAATLEGWLAAGHHASMSWLARERKRSDPRALLPGCRTVVVLAMDYFGPASVPSRPGGHGRVPIDASRVRAVLESARARGATTLVEPDGYALLDALGVARPAAITVPSADAVASADPSTLGTDRVVVKIASTTVLHRSDAGGVVVVANTREAVAQSIDDMTRGLPAEGLEGFTVNAFVAHEATLGGELLIGLRWTEDFGPVVTVGPGGIYTEFLSRHLRPGADIAILPVEGLDEGRVEARLRRLPVVQLALGGVRGQRSRIRMDDLIQVVGAFMALGRISMPDLLSECEVNPLVATARGLVALDVLARLGSPRPVAWPARPLRKLRNLLATSRVAIIGVSESMNPGHVILDNLLREGFPPGDIIVVPR